MKNKKMIPLTVALCALVAATVLTYFPVRGEEKIYGDVIRLHVIAASDSEADQSLKLEVRDAVLDEITSYPAPKDKAEAAGAIEAHRDDIKRRAEDVLRAAGSTDEVEVYFDRETYPVRYYEDFALPAGEYSSLRVVIGEGEGRNWWCVLFPPVCTSAAKSEDDFIEAGFTGDEYRLIEKNRGAKYKVRFKILEILADVFGFDY